MSLFYLLVFPNLSSALKNAAVQDYKLEDKQSFYSFFFFYFPSGDTKERPELAHITKTSSLQSFKNLHFELSHKYKNKQSKTQLDTHLAPLSDAWTCPCAGCKGLVWWWKLVKDHLGGGNALPLVTTTTWVWGEYGDGRSQKQAWSRPPQEPRGRAAALQASFGLQTTCPTYFSPPAHSDSHLLLL